MHAKVFIWGKVKYSLISSNGPLGLFSCRSETFKINNDGYRSVLGKLTFLSNLLKKY